MVFQTHTYSVLVVSAAEKFSASLTALLPAGDYWPVRTAGSAAEARRLLPEQSWDIVVINSPLPDESGAHLAVDVCAGSDACALLFVKNDDLFGDVSAQVLEYGVLTVAKPTSEASVLLALRALCAARERVRRLGQRQASVEEKIAEIRVVNHAKWLLIQHRGMTEAEAHRHIEKQAMDTRSTRRAVADGIIQTYEPS